MNRLCQSSYGNLEAVINISGYNGDPQRKLVHFSQDRITGQWSACGVISNKAVSGGSIIQNVSKRRADQEHGDFEVVVLEDGGALQHYTRDNTVPVDNGVYSWQLSATINAAPSDPDDVSSDADDVSCDTPPSETASETAAPENEKTNAAAYKDETTSAAAHPENELVAAIYAAPLSQYPSLKNGAVEWWDETTIGTIVINGEKEARYYYCEQYKAGYESVQPRDEWHRLGNGAIATDVVGPACIYYTSLRDMMVLIPVADGVKQYRYNGHNYAWELLNVVTTMSGPSCVYANLSAGNTEFHALVCSELGIHERADYKKCWKDSESTLSGPISHTPYHKILDTNPIAVLSQPYSTLSQSHNTEALVFQACGTGLQDTWMVLYWSLVVGTGKWVLCGVVLPHVVGMSL